MNFFQIANGLARGAVVGTVHSTAALAAARKATAADCDLLELRLDSFSFPGGPRDAARLPLPRIVTARHPAEGGLGRLPASRRRDLYLEFMEEAAFLDIELRSVPAMTPVIERARRSSVKVILSYHNFLRTPPKGKLKEMADLARNSGADIFKVATLTRSGSDLAVLIDFLSTAKKTLPVAAMGMGPLGKISRLALAQCGSCLNYGYLGSPNASGQWPVRLLKDRLQELRESPGKKKAAG